MVTSKEALFLDHNPFVWGPMKIKIVTWAKRQNVVNVQRLKINSFVSHYLLQYGMDLHCPAKAVTMIIAMIMTMIIDMIITMIIAMRITLIITCHHQCIKASFVIRVLPVSILYYPRSSNSYRRDYSQTKYYILFSIKSTGRGVQCV